MSDDLVKVTVSEGKYTFGQRKDGSCYALRYGEPWREDIFDGLTLAMAHHIEVLEAAFSNLSREYDKRADRIEELEANLAEQIEWVKCLADDLIAAEGREARLKDKLAELLGVGDAMAASIEGNYYVSGIAKMWREAINIKGEQP